jgi:peptidoglycan/xylan/chitin deacetylase (PgdA/CDA1 family)
MRSAGYFAKLGATALAKGLLGLARGGVRDPYSRFERWLELEEKFGFRSTFFFPSDIDGRRHPEDPEYSFDDKIYFQGRRVAVGEMMRWMHKHGWEVGIHGTWYTREDAEFLAAQRRRVESVIGAPVVSNRQHYLRYDPIKTPHVLQQAGLKIDSTLGFNRDIGFRRGTCWPHRLYDPANQRATDVVSVPLVAQDSALFVSDSLHLDKHGATASVIALLEHVQHYRGCVAIGWHPNTFEDTLYQGWFAAYEAILQWIKQHNGWGCSLVQAVQVWRESRP